MSTTVCHPQADRLQDYAVGRLEEPAARDVEEHLATCPACRDAVETAPDDAFVAGIQRCHQGEVAAVPAKPLPLYERVKALLGPADEKKQVAPVSPWQRDLPRGLADHQRYRIVEVLGHGGMGRVYKARHLVMGRDVALKVIRARLLARPEAVERFGREVRAAARLVHPNIVTAYDAESCSDVHFLVMEYVEGQPLSALAGRLSVAQACEYIRQAALGLQHAHEKGMVHRDIKPHNLILTAAGQVKILDFGLARFISEAAPDAATADAPAGGHLTACGTIMGSLDYMAPEQAADPHTADIRADVYSLGCTLYYLLTETAPFPEATTLEAKLEAHRSQRPLPLNRLCAGVPAGLAELVERILAKNPADRPATPGEVAAALEPFTEDPPAAADAPVVEVPRPRRRRIGVAVGVALLCLFGVTGTFFAPTVYRFTTNQGTLVIESDDPDVEVVVKGGGKEYIVRDLKAKRELTLKAGKYEVEIASGNEGLTLSARAFTLTRNGKAIARVRAAEKSAEPARAPDDPAEVSLPIVQLQEVREMRGHTGWISSVAISRDGKRAMSGSIDGTGRVWDLATGKELSSTPYPGYDLFMLYSPDGKYAVIAPSPTSPASKDCDIRLCDASTGEEVRRLKGHRGGVGRNVSFSKDGSRVLTGCIEDGTLRLWEVESGKLLRAVIVPPNGLLPAALSPDGRLALSGGWDGSVRLWDLETGEERHSFDRHGEMVTAVAFSPDGRHALTASLDSAMRLWDVESGKLVRSFAGHLTGIVHAEFSRDGRWIVSCSGTRPAGDTGWLAAGFDERVRLWDVASGLELARFDVPQPLMATLSPDGKFLLAGSRSCFLKLLKVTETAKKVTKQPLPAEVDMAWPEEDLRQGKVKAPDMTRIKPIQHDDFNDAQSGYPKVKKEGQNEVGYEDGKYFVSLHPPLIRTPVNGPWGRFTHFACQMVARLTESSDARWGLTLTNESPRRKHGITATIDRQGRLLVEPYPGEQDAAGGPQVGPLKHPAIKAGNEFNTLLIVVRGRQVEVYANGSAVCQPILLRREITPSYLWIELFSPEAGKEKVKAEFERVTLWPAESIPTLRERGAVAK